MKITDSYGHLSVFIRESRGLRYHFQGKLSNQTVNCKNYVRETFCFIFGEKFPYKYQGVWNEMNTGSLKKTIKELKISTNYVEKASSFNVRRMVLGQATKKSVKSCTNN